MSIPPPPDWFPTPTEPALDAAPALVAALDRMAEQGRKTGAADLPPAEGLEPVVLVRWMYRAWLSAQARWRALVHVNPAWLPSGCRLDGPELTDVLEQAAGGWLLLGPGWEALAPREELARQARGRQIRLFLTTPGAARVGVPSALARQLAWLDQHHRVAVDPSLAPLRRSLLAHCRAAGLIALSGPAGSGKRSLVRWAQAALEPTAGLSVIRAPQPDRVQGGRWVLFEEPGQLDPGWLEPLRARLALDGEGWSPPPDTTPAPPRPPRPELAAIIGESAATRRVLDRAVRLARSALPVLIRGETGVGKESMAEAIHALSGRSGPLVAIDLSSRSEALIDSELFGHVKGSFTGAARDHRGCFQEAHGGTLFLDELGNLSLALQAKLLRAIQQREVLPVGGSRALPVDVRIVAATNADLEGEIRRGTFRQDLLYRLNPGAALWLPPLRDRPEDIPLLVEHFLQELSAASGWPAPEIDPDAMTLLQDWPWPGNIRELRQVIETASVESGGAPIGPEHLGPLAPAARRAVPLLLTSADPEEDWERLWPLRRDEVHRLRAVTLRVPALNERDPRALRSAVLASLAGRPIRSRALAVLEHRAWWGHYTELDHAMEAVRHNIEGVVDLTNLEARLPHLVQDSGRAPLEVLMFPSRGEDGRVQGLHQVVREGALVIGRASSLRDLEPGPHTPPEVAARLKRRANALHELLGSHQPAFLRLDLLPQLARAHLVIQHAGEGLKIHALPELELPIEVWGANDPLAFALLPERSVDVGPAAELRLLSGDGEQVLLRLFVFKGALAREDLAARLIQRSGADAVAETLGVPSAVAGDGDGERGYRGLDVAEREAFIRLLRTWFETGGAFAIHVRQFARKISEDPLIGWLGRRLDTVHPTQDCGRLVEHKDNEALRAELVAELRRQPDARAACDRLPKRLRDTLSPRLD